MPKRKDTHKILILGSALMVPLGGLGRYWVVVLVQGKEYSHAIEYVSRQSEQNGAELFSYLKNGELQLGRVIDVD
jgi:hypothetical protein